MIQLLADIVLTNETGVTVGVMIVIIMAVTWLLGKFSSLEGRYKSLSEKVEAAWTQTDMKVWSQDLDNANSTLTTVPDPYITIANRRARERKGL